MFRARIDYDNVIVTTSPQTVLLTDTFNQGSANASAVDEYARQCLEHRRVAERRQRRRVSSITPDRHSACSKRRTHARPDRERNRAPAEHSTRPSPTPLSG